MLDSFPLVPALLLGLILYCPGACWGWMVSFGLCGWKAFFAAGFLSVAGGIVLCALGAAVLGELGLFFPAVSLAGWLALCLSGAAAGVFFRRRAFGLHLWRALPGGAVFFALMLCTLGPSGRSQWICGGWDPGVYVNAGVALSRTGSFYPSDAFFQDQLNEQQQSLFLRFAGRKIERFPGVMADAERKTLHFHFFRLTPALIGVFDRCAGLTGAVRANTVTGLGALAGFFLFALVRFGPRTAVFAAPLLAASPVFLYHLSTPVSEMLELLMLVLLLLLFSERGKSVAAAGALVLSALIINRFSFLPFAGLFMTFGAAVEIREPGRRAVYVRRALQTLGLILGAAADAWTSPDTLLAWKVLPMLAGVAAVFVAAAWVIDVFGPGWLPRLSALRLRPGAVMFFLGAVFGAALLLRPWIQPHSPEAYNFLRLVQYAGFPLAVLAAAGAAVLFLRRPAEVSVSAAAASGFLVLVAGLILFEKSIVNIYPWALRRHVSFALPALCLLGGFFAASVCAGARPRLRLAAAALLVVSQLLWTAPIAARAARCAEYAGLVPALERVAGEIAPGDVLVADHFWWGTPLQCVFGRTVLNGERILPNRFNSAEASQALAGVFSQGFTVRFLTSVDAGAEEYAKLGGDFRVDRDFGPEVFDEIVHHRGIKDFVLASKKVHFRLYTWTPAAEEDSAGGKDAAVTAQTGKDE